ncbi:16S rRNA (uracil1498-N3)-methyltransferase [Sinobacterium caligoides]|uniref:Ribosomal RNA small subunit methyltransferase E n=1 Tax=Sinobacterium caligoides TaxID=933926 RepID=A0A3N2DGJ6_9GAMM|nr:16S rRNA (uracil(1498)-N(3))-methyltransferase [Sinobacterium caligoides]ROR98915.1 16S rRNA (uracil1498-N3)-methyltransferase [Sinobacterium caligoides]
MRIPRIYSAVELNDHQIVELDSSASHHLIKVLRFKLGYQLILFNGCGQQVNATVCELNKKSVKVQTEQVDDCNKESPLRTVLGIALSKGDRFDWVVQKATEMGVSEIQPLFSERSEVKLSPERLEKKHASWQQIIIGACEQCQRNTLPQLLPTCTLDDWLAKTDCTEKLVLHHRSEQGLGQTRPESVALLIGPEGGLSEQEINRALSAGFKALTLGPRVLRTETAPITALSILQYRWGDLA